MRSAILSSESVAGPRVQTIFARRTVSRVIVVRRPSRPTVGTSAGHQRVVCGPSQTVIWRTEAASGLGRFVEPIRNSSIDAAAARPSAIAHTINDWPRPASPATNTPGHVAGVVVVAHQVAAGVPGQTQLPGEGLRLGTHETHRQRHQVGGQHPLANPPTSTGRPSTHSTSMISRPVSIPFSPRKRLVEAAYTRSPPSSWADDTRNTIG